MYDYCLSSTAAPRPLPLPSRIRFEPRVSVHSPTANEPPDPSAFRDSIFGRGDVPFIFCRPLRDYCRPGQNITLNFPPRRQYSGVVVL